MRSVAMGHLRCLKTILEPAGPLPGRMSPEVARLNVRGRKAFPRWAKTRVHGCATTQGVKIRARFCHLLSRRQTLASEMGGHRSPAVCCKGTKTLGEDTRWLSRPPRSPLNPVVLTRT